jgi:hypothetical protein
MCKFTSDPIAIGLKSEKFSRLLGFFGFEIYSGCLVTCGVESDPIAIGLKDEK